MGSNSAADSKIFRWNFFWQSRANLLQIASIWMSSGSVDLTSTVSRETSGGCAALTSICTLLSQRHSSPDFTTRCSSADL